MLPLPLHVSYNARSPFFLLYLLSPIPISRNITSIIPMKLKRHIFVFVKTAPCKHFLYVPRVKNVSNKIRFFTLLQLINNVIFATIFFHKQILLLNLQYPHQKNLSGALSPFPHPFQKKYSCKKKM